jgi:hypothetical protein
MKGGNMSRDRRKGELREATESLLISVKVVISRVTAELEALQKERAFLQKKLDEQE